MLILLLTIPFYLLILLLFATLLFRSGGGGDLIQTDSEIAFNADSHSISASLLADLFLS